MSAILFFKALKKLSLLKFGVKFVFVTPLAAKNKTPNLPLSVTKVICLRPLTVTTGLEKSTISNPRLEKNASFTLKCLKKSLILIKKAGIFFLRGVVTLKTHPSKKMVDLRP